MTTTNELPPSASMSGKNSTYIACNDVGRRANYAVCLFTIQAVGRGKNLSDTECQNAICAGTCLAKKMQAEEMLAGKALYYMERVIREPEARPMAAPAPIRSSIWSRAAPAAPKQEKKAPASKIDFGASGLSSAITVAMKEHKSMSGMSLLERIKLKKEEA